MGGATAVCSSVVLLMLISMMSETKGIRMKRDMQDEQEEKMQDEQDEKMHELEHHEGVMRYLIGGIGALEARVIKEQAEKKSLEYEHQEASNYYTTTDEEGFEHEQKKEERYDQQREERIVNTRGQLRNKNPVQQYVDNGQTRVSGGLGQYGQKNSDNRGGIK